MAELSLRAGRERDRSPESAQTMPALAEPISPELVLVAEDLREAAIAALPARVWQIYAPAATRQDELPAAPLGGGSVVLQALLYAAWHAVIGALLGVGVFVTVVLALLALRAFA